MSAASDFDIDRYVDRIRAFDGPQFEVRVEATVQDGARAQPILSVSSRTVAPKTLLVLAGVHGNERAGLLAVPFVLEAWTSNRVRLVVVTPVNPVGAARGTRESGQGYDINRDFVRFATPEARVVRDVFERTAPDFVISLHEGPQDGTFIFANAIVDPTMAAALCDALATGGTPLAERDYFGLRLRPRGLSSASRITRAVWKVWALVFRSQASIVYSQERGVPEIVLESSSRVKGEPARVRPHVDLVAAVAARL